MKSVLLSALLLLAISAQARLGETETQLTNRYGSALQVKTENGVKKLTFNFGAYYILAHCRDGRSVVEFAYVKKRDGELPDTVALAVASTIAGSTNWTVLDRGPAGKTWAIKNPPRIAILNAEPGKPKSIMVTTPQELDRQPQPQNLAPGF